MITADNSSTDLCDYSRCLFSAEFHREFLHYPAVAQMCPHACKLALSQINVPILSVSQS